MKRNMSEIAKKKITFNPRLIVELAENLCTHYLHAFREVCSNAYDADAERVDINILPHEIQFEDYGTDTGIKDVDQFLDKGSPYKQTVEVTPKFKRKVIGSKGLGSLSVFKLGKRVDVVSNNGSEGHFLSLSDESLEADYLHYINPYNALPHVGTKIIVRNLKRSAEPEEVRKYLGKTFQLLLSKDFRIFVDKQEVKPPVKLLPPNVDIDTAYGKISGRLEKKGGQINIFLRGVFVKGEVIEPNRLASGYVNVDFLIPTTDREDFVRDNDQWREFSDKIRSHIATNYPPRRELVSKSFRKLLNKVAKNLTRAVARLKLLIEGATPTSEQGETGEIPDTLKKRKKKKEIEEKELVHIKEEKKEKVRLTRFQAKVMKKVVGRSIKTGFGLKIRTAPAGEKARPVIPVPPNTVVVNIENPIVKILHEGKRYKPSEAELLLSRLVMEAYTDLVGKNPSKKEFLEITDRLTLESLKE
jgi:hypothetical protein